MGTLPPTEVVEGLGPPLVTARATSSHTEVQRPVEVMFCRSQLQGMDLFPPRRRSLPFLLGEGLAPVHARLVAKILKGDYVDMAKLLRDNLEAHWRGWLQDSSVADSCPTSKRQRCEIPNLLSWVQCFGSYMGVVNSRHPEKIKQLLVYQTLIVREAPLSKIQLLNLELLPQMVPSPSPLSPSTARCGGCGWLAYDSMFRQQAAGNPSVDWSRLNVLSVLPGPGQPRY